MGCHTVQMLKQEMQPGVAESRRQQTYLRLNCPANLFLSASVIEQQVNSLRASLVNLLHSSLCHQRRVGESHRRTCHNETTRLSHLDTALVAGVELYDRNSMLVALLFKGLQVLDG